MREIDLAAVEKYGIPSLALMENAGSSVAAFLLEKFPKIKNMKILIACGNGNNGGDGFVISRILKSKGIAAKTWLFGGKEKCSKEAKAVLALLLKNKCRLKEVSGDQGLEVFAKALKDKQLVVDALLGTGFRGNISGILGRAIELINLSPAIVVSVDIPSGLNADNGTVAGKCVKADFTVALGLVKLGSVSYPGVNYTGKIIVKNIGLPFEAVKQKKVRLNYTTEEDVRACFPKRPLDCNKGSVGRILVVGGSAGMTGAPCLTSLSALRTGSGLVTVACSKSLNDILEIKLTEVMTSPVQENPDRSLSSRAENSILKLLDRHDVLVLGPGLGKNRDTGILVRNLIRKCKKPVVLDADGLNLIASSPGILKEKKADIVITPHPGEMSRLTGLSIEEVQKTRVNTALAFAKKYGVVTLLKGACTVTAFPDGNIYINSTGNPGMATAGTGDVLAGIIASLLGQKIEPGMAAVSGAFLHGMAGDLAGEKKGEHGLIASDILSYIPEAVLNITKARR